MKIYHFILVLMMFASCKEKLNDSKQNFINENISNKDSNYQKDNVNDGFINIENLTVKEFLLKLKVKENEENNLNILTTIGQAKHDWLTIKDLEFLISKVNSNEKAKCIKRSISSYIPNPENMTIGNQAVSIIEAYKNKEAYPNELYICKIHETSKINEILDWWKKLKNQ